MQIEDRAKKIKAVIFDADGVLTDGRIIYGNYGDELKFFNVQDGLGMLLLRAAGIHTFIISGKSSKIVSKRAKETNITKSFQNVGDKLAVYLKLKKKFSLDDEDFCYIGDDMPDLPVISRVGFACAVLNAQEEIKEKAHYVTKNSGGSGAVREVVNIILKAQNKWRETAGKYYK